MSIYLKKLKTLAKKNPEIAALLEEEFPEIRDDRPYILDRQLFFRRNYEDNIYILYYEKGVFRVQNLKDGKIWKGAISKNRSTEEGYYLTKREFSDLLRASAVKLEHIRFIKKERIIELHRKLHNYY